MYSTAAAAAAAAGLSPPVPCWSMRTRARTGSIGVSCCISRAPTAHTRSLALRIKQDPTRQTNKMNITPLLAHTTTLLWQTYLSASTALVATYRTLYHHHYTTIACRMAPYRHTQGRRRGARRRLPASVYPLKTLTSR